MSRFTDKTAIVGTTESLTADEFREMIDTNLVGTFLGMHTVLPSTRRAGGGSIVNINSTAGLGSQPDSPPTGPASGASAA